MVIYKSRKNGKQFQKFISREFFETTLLKLLLWLEFLMKRQVHNNSRQAFRPINYQQLMSEDRKGCLMVAL